MLKNFKFVVKYIYMSLYIFNNTKGSNFNERT